MRVCTALAAVVLAEGGGTGNHSKWPKPAKTTALTSQSYLSPTNGSAVALRKADPGRPTTQCAPAGPFIGLRGESGGFGWFRPF